ncbi:OPN3 [Branchiostoma lanceolatum]|uniref:Opsin-3 n=1 Tax=Branchiostoma lanceolatum TaxID=7740 RepID=A0A8K0EBV1_BRALA|nr:OPN3 [Branchiostoma lanceolatum]
MDLNMTDGWNTSTAPWTVIPLGEVNDHPLLPYRGFIVVAAVLATLCAGGIVSNFAVLLMFWQYPTLRTPFNMLLLNLSVSGLIVSVAGIPFSLSSSIYGRWIWGRGGCVYYGFTNSFCGILSMITLTVIAYQRYKITVRPPGAANLKYPEVTKAIIFIWIYGFVWTTPPLFGWSSYELEGPRISCSVDWSSHTGNDTSYIMVFFVTCLIIPLGVIAVCYVRLWKHVHERAGQQHNKKSVASKAEGRIGMMVVVLITCFLLCWLPYGLVALVVTFGEPRLITPTAAIVCTLMAKSSVMWNPVIYVVMNNQFRRHLVALLRCLRNAESTGPTPV